MRTRGTPTVSDSAAFMQTLLLLNIREKKLIYVGRGERYEILSLMIKKSKGGKESRGTIILVSGTLAEIVSNAISKVMITMWVVSLRKEKM